MRYRTTWIISAIIISVTGCTSSPHDAERLRVGGLHPEALRKLELAEYQIIYMALFDRKVIPELLFTAEESIAKCMRRLEAAA